MIVEDRPAASILHPALHTAQC